LHLESESNTFFNFTASHDGIGVRPLEGILPNDEIKELIEIVKENGGYVAYKLNPDGSESPYELNITYIDALLNKKMGIDKYHSNRFLASQAIQYTLPGVPATYIQSLLGSRNWEEGVRLTNRARTINREKLQIDNVLSELENPESFRSKIFYKYFELIKVRRRQPAFHPNAPFKIIEVGSKAFAIGRYCKDQVIYAITNISSKSVTVSLSEDGVPNRINDLLTGSYLNKSSIRLEPYQYVWLSTK